MPYAFGYMPGDSTEDGILSLIAINDFFGQLITLPLVLLQGNDIVGVSLDDGLGYFPLTPHGVNGDDAIIKVQRMDQRWDGRDLIAFIVHFHLPQGNAIGGGPCRDHP